MEFFLPCWIALGSLFADAPSKSYMHKASKTFAARLHICNTVAQEAERQSVDPILAISIARYESGFTENLTSKRGAKGVLGVMPRYHCPKNSKCNYTKAGIRAIKAVTRLYPDDLCRSLAVYNRGTSGVCKEGRSEYYYATRVIELYEDICSIVHICETC